MADGKNIKITLIKSGIARPGKHKRVLEGLGLRKLNRTVVRPDTPEIRGMISKVSHLLQVENE
ncbi:MAG: 50S ribosomal protein L30 [Nitrospiraceae bacterium]|nr:50S ribosomal protein L30 [Nitrospiraceae bacterium]